MTLILKFEGDRLHFDGQLNVGFGPNRQLRLVGKAVTLDQGRLYIDNVGGILAALQACVQDELQVAGTGAA